MTDADKARATLSTLGVPPARLARYTAAELATLAAQYDERITPYHGLLDWFRAFEADRKGTPAPETETESDPAPGPSA